MSNFHRGDIISLTDGTHWFVDSTKFPDGTVAVCTKLYGAATRTNIKQALVGDLVQRGNHYKHSHSLPLDFDSLDEEISFYTELKVIVPLRNPADHRYYSWTLGQAISALQSYAADAFFWGPGLNSKLSFGGFTVTVPEFAARLREHSLKGLLALPSET